MEQRDAPARPLWDRIQTICATRGWNGVRLERETGVARQTINKWRTQPRPPQAATVNQVATVLGIPLEEALRLAGILPGEQPVAPVAADEGDLTVDEAELVERIRRDPRKRRRLLDALLAGYGHEPRSTEQDSSEQPGHKAS